MCVLLFEFETWPVIRASVGDVGGMLLLLLLLLMQHYPEEKMVNVYFWNNNEKLLQAGLDSDLKEEPELRSWSCFILFKPVMPESWICLNLNLGKYAWICVTLWI